MRVTYRTFGCKTNQYDTERMRQVLESRGAETCLSWDEADLCVVNTCTVTDRADADARRLIRRVRRENPGARVLVVGCSAILQPNRYRAMAEVHAVVEGHDPEQVCRAAEASVRQSSGGATEVRGASAAGAGVGPALVPLLLDRRRGASRGWLKIQDGCDRKCSFCATRLARGASSSRPVEEVVAEARVMARSHDELVLTGIHIGHYGRDLGSPNSLSALLERLLDSVPSVRFRLGSVEATELEERTLHLMSGAGGRVAPHLHMPLQSGSDAVLRRMRRWHTRDAYRRKVLRIAERVPYLGLGADVVVGFPGETDADHGLTRDLVEELPFTYLHVFPFSRRRGTAASELPDPVPERVAGERSRELRELARDKGRAHRQRRRGGSAAVVPDGRGRALTGDYLRVRVRGTWPGGGRGPIRGSLRGPCDDLYIELPRNNTAN